MEQNEIIKAIHPGFKTLIQEKGWKSGLMEIQLKAIPKILDGFDCIIQAPTAGGKTEAVLFPTLSKAAANKTDSVQILYLAPLRALLNDIEKRANQYASVCGLHSFKWHGDVNQKEKINEFNCPSQLLLTTPESLEAIMLRKSGWKEFFSGLKSIIIDEAHNFAFGDRGSHLMTLIERLEAKLNKKCQRIALSASIGNPEEMLLWLAGKNRKKGIVINVGADVKKEKKYNVIFFDKYNEKGVELNQAVNRLNYLYNELLPANKTNKSLVFGKSRTNTEAIAEAINEINKISSRGIPLKVRTHHSSLSKFYREEAENKIKIKNDLESGIDTIISTSTLELGIDIGELDQIVQLDSIPSSSSFLQRVGRTGRRPEKPQVFQGLCLKEGDLILMAAVVSLGFKGISEEIHFPKTAYHILSHQLICLCLQNHGISPKAAWNILSRSYCFSEISEKNYNDVVSYMVSKGYLRNVDGELVVGEETEKTFLGSNWRRLFAVFESAPMYEVYQEKKHIGYLDSTFVEPLEVPFLFVLGGQEWKAYKIKRTQRQIFVNKTEKAIAPKWVTFQGLEVPKETAEEAGKILCSNITPNFLNPSAKKMLNIHQKKYSKVNWKKGVWIIYQNSHEIEIITFAGDRINGTFAGLISVYELGKPVTNYYSIVIKPTDKERAIDFKSIMELIERLKNASNEGLNQFRNFLKKNITKKFPSKFSKLLPDNLIAEIIFENSYDFDGLVKDLMENTVEIRDKVADSFKD